MQTRTGRQVLFALLLVLLLVLLLGVGLLICCPNWLLDVLAPGLFMNQPFIPPSR